MLTGRLMRLILPTSLTDIQKMTLGMTQGMETVNQSTSSGIKTPSLDFDANMYE
jgi:hypothetical protein